MRAKRFFVSAVLVLSLCGGAYAGIPISRVDNFLEQIQAQLGQMMNSMTRISTMINGLDSLDALKGLTGKFDELKNMFGGLSKFQFDIGGLAGGMMGNMSSTPFSQSDVKDETRTEYKKRNFRKASDSLAKDIEEFVKKSSDTTRTGISPTDGADDAAKEIVAELGKFYFASLPGVAEEASRLIFTSSGTRHEAGVASRALGETARAKTQEKWTEMRAPYIKDKDGKNVYRKKLDEVMEAERKTSEKLEKDVSKAGNELEVLRMIASMTAAMVERQGHSNLLLAIKIEQSMDTVEHLAHIAAMTSQLYGRSVEESVRFAAEGAQDETRQKLSR